MKFLPAIIASNTATHSAFKTLAETSPKIEKTHTKERKKIKWMKWMVGPIEVKIVYWNTLIFCSTKIWFSRCFVDVVTDHKRECELFSFYLILSSAQAVGWGEHEFICQYTSISMEISVQHCAMCANCAHSIQHSSWIYICTRHVYSSIANSYTRTKVDECFILFYAFFLLFILLLLMLLYSNKKKHECNECISKWMLQQFISRWNYLFCVCIGKCWSFFFGSNAMYGRWRKMDANCWIYEETFWWMLMGTVREMKSVFDVARLLNAHRWSGFECIHMWKSDMATCLQCIFGKG